jgi:hypothetical protein
MRINRCKQLLNERKEKKEYSNLKQDALERILRRRHFGSAYSRHRSVYSRLISVYSRVGSVYIRL